MSWVDVPGIITEQTGISREVQNLREALEEQRKKNEESQLEMQRLGEDQLKLREEQGASLARHKADLDAAFSNKVQETVLTEMNSAMQAAGFSDLASALATLRNLGSITSANASRSA